MNVKRLSDILSRFLNFLCFQPGKLDDFTAVPVEEDIIEVLF